MIQDKLHQQICDNFEAVKNWFLEQHKELGFSVYSSFDMRDSGQKVAPVDANVFPAGFNNICDVDKEGAVELMKGYLQDNYSLSSGVVALITEEHTNNPYYWQNVFTLNSFIEDSGFTCLLCYPRSLQEPLEVKTINGQSLKVYGLEVESGIYKVEGQQPDLILTNNDFSQKDMSHLASSDVKFNPPYEMGWHRRRKSDFFDRYNKLVKSFSESIDVDPGYIDIQTKLFQNFDITSEESRESLATAVDQQILELKNEYDRLKIETDPFVFVKNNAGTYGLGVIKAKSGEEVLNWNYKAKKKMKATKGGGGVSEVIIQEGIPTRFTEDGVTAEPSIYLIGDQLAGGFLRAHPKKGPQDSLNAPGAVYQRLCVSDLKVHMEDCPMENVYGWLSRIGAIAIAQEIQAL